MSSGPRAAAVGPTDRELGLAVLVDVLEAERGGGPPENLGAAASPYLFGGGVEMTDLMILIQDHDSVVRPLECGQQDVGDFGRRSVGHRHQRGFIPREGHLH